jgi:hypothetical protein
MAFKTFAPGVLTSSDVNTFLMRQSVIVCTSSTRPGSPNEGMTIYETDTDAFAFYTGTAWRYTGHYQSYTPTLATSGYALGNGTLTGGFAQMGKFVHGHVTFTFGSTTTFTSTTLEISPPVVINSTATLNNSVIGSGYAIDASPAVAYPVLVDRLSTNFRIRPMSKALVGVDFVGQAGPIIDTVPFTWATSDVLQFSFYYQES